MKVIFGTTNKRKVEDLENIVEKLNLDIQILSLDDINWDRGEIDENGQTIEENSLIKANAIHNFCNQKKINYTIITDDAGLFCDALDNEPGVNTSRYAIDEQENNPKHQCVIKLLRKLENENNRNAKYRCVVTCMMPDGSYYQESGETYGEIATSIIGELKKPYFYAVFIPNGYNKPFSDLEKDELNETYRYKALKKSLKKIQF